MSSTSLRWRLHRLILRAWRHVPMPLRSVVVRLASPTYSAGSIVLVEREHGELLLIQQSYRHGWGLPGGLLAKGETPQRAACREVLEEVGLEIELIGSCRLVLDVVHRRLDFVHRARLPHTGLAQTARPTSPEILQARWFARDDLPPLQPETAEAIAALEGPESGPMVISSP